MYNVRCLWPIYSNVIIHTMVLSDMEAIFMLKYKAKNSWFFNWKASLKMGYQRQYFPQIKSNYLGIFSPLTTDSYKLEFIEKNGGLVHIKKLYFIKILIKQNFICND